MTNKRHDHWRVSVETSGENIVSIEPEMLGGREPSEADIDAIRTAAHHLLAFIGDTPSPLPHVMAGKFALGDRVCKTKGSSWHGRVVGFYRTELTPIGYAIESEREPGSVQIYPEAALSTATEGSGE